MLGRANMAKRGGGAQQVELDEAMVVSSGRAAEVVALDEVLMSLAELDPRKGRWWNCVSLVV